jgi:pantetheine-phosphate adenylyltransferase
MKKALFAGSFDPLTNGHIYMVKQGIAIFDHLDWVIAENPLKKNWFSSEVRESIIKEVLKTEFTLKESQKISVQVLRHDFLADFAKKQNIGYSLRGIRNVREYEEEKLMQRINQDINPDLETVFFFPPAFLEHYSSQTVKSIFGHENWENILVKFCPPATIEVLKK